MIRHRRRGDVFPAASMAEKLAAAYERQAAVLFDRERAAGAKRSTSLEAIAAELEAGEA